MVLAGHFQTDLYAFAGLALAGAGLTRWTADGVRRSAGSLATIAALALLVSAVQNLPTPWGP
jgi:hypothetical protein